MLCVNMLPLRRRWFLLITGQHKCEIQLERHKYNPDKKHKQSKVQSGTRITMTTYHIVDPLFVHFIGFPRPQRRLPLPNESFVVVVGYVFCGVVLQCCVPTGVCCCVLRLLC